MATSRRSPKPHLYAVEPLVEPIEDERTLVERARSDPSAFGALFDRYHDPILTYLVHRTADVHLARELASNTFFKALSRLETFRWKRVPFSAWLYRIASNEVATHYRRRRRERIFGGDVDEQTAPRDPAASPLLELLEAERRLAQHRLFLKLHAAIRRLKLRYQEVIVLRFFEKKKIREIADITGKRQGTVKSLLSRAVSQLSRLVEDDDPAEVFRP